jgi:hypothetical protein
MTGIAWSSDVGPLQPEISAVMLFQCKREEIESLGIMAVGTILDNTLFDELVIVIILVAIQAPVVFDRGCDACFVAFLAWDIQMLVLQPEVGP